MKRRILALCLVLVMMLTVVGCSSDVSRSTANNRPGDFIFNSLDNTKDKYSDSISSVSDILSEAVNGGSVKVSYNDDYYSFDNVLYMNAEEAQYTNYFDGQVYGDDVNFALQLDQGDFTMWSDEDLFTYDLYGDGYDAYTFEAEMVAMMLSDNYNTDKNANNPVNFEWLIYQLTRIMQLNEEFKEDMEDDLKELFNNKFNRYSAESTDVDVDGNDVACVVLKYNLDEYDVADVLDTVLNNYLDYFYNIGATGVKKQCFVITDAIQTVKDYVEKSLANLDFVLTVAKDTKSIVALNVTGNIDVAGEKMDVDGSLNLGRVASYFTPVTGSLTLSGDSEYKFTVQTDATTDDASDYYRLYAAAEMDGTTVDFADIYFSYDKSTNEYKMHSNSNGNIIETTGKLEIGDDKFDADVTYAKIGNDEYYPDLKITVSEEADAPKAPSSTCVIEEEYDPETGELRYSAYDSLVDIIDNEVKTAGLMSHYDDIKSLVNKVIRNSPIKDAADKVLTFVDKNVTPEYDEYTTEANQ